MPINILMPALSPTMEKGNLSKWLKHEGDRIKAGDVLAEIETDKATMEVEAVDEGVLAKIVVPEGTSDVPVNDVIGIIAGDGEDAKASAAPAPATAKVAEKPAEKAAPAPVAAAPAAKVLNGGGDANRVFASPLAKRVAKDAGLTLAQVTGTGPHGRIVERDVRAAIGAGPLPVAAKAPAAKAPDVPAARAPVALASDESILKLFEPGSYETVPHDSIRKIIARRLVEAKQTIPHFYLSVDCELDRLLAAREAINAEAPKGKDGTPAYRLSVNDFVVKALAVALMRVPDANATWTETALLKHKHADIAVAVAIPGGLITPIVRQADTKTLSAISREVKDFSARARARKLLPEEYSGGTSAVSNLGMYGVKNFSAVINPPQASILAVGAGEERVIVRNGAPAVANVMSVTLSVDHRAVDGALGAELLRAFKGLIENPIGMLV